jgi:D-lactate dehydrogenase (cytochrome)
VRAGVDIAAMELLDDNQMRTINMVKATNRTWAEQPTLFLKFAGTKAGVREQIDIVANLAKANNGGKFEFAKNDKEKKDLWSARKVYCIDVEVMSRKHYSVCCH